jgi:hypothetical protein
MMDGVIFEYDPINNTFELQKNLEYPLRNKVKGGLTLYKGRFFGKTSTYIFEWMPDKNKIEILHTYNDNNYSGGSRRLSLHNGILYGSTTANIGTSTWGLHRPCASVSTCKSGIRKADGSNP